MTNQPTNTDRAPSYTVGPIRAAGLQARWTRTREGAPIIAARNPNAGPNWYVIDARTWAMMTRHGIAEGFDRCTMLGGIFSIPA